MNKGEFEQRVGQSVSDKDYRVIETVYQWHPAVKEVSGKDEVAELYKSFGMTIFYDMMARAEVNREMEKELRHAQAEVERIKREIEEISINPYFIQLKDYKEYCKNIQKEGP